GHGAALHEFESASRDDDVRLDYLRPALDPDRQRHLHGGVLSVGLVVVRHLGGALFVVAGEAQPRNRLCGVDAAYGEAAHYQRLRDRRLLPLYAARACSSGPESLPVAQAAGRALVWQEGLAMKSRILTLFLLVGVAFTGAALVPRLSAYRLPGNQQG